MSENKVLFTGEKESFITRVLIKKIKEAGVDCSFVPWTINDINSNIDSAAMIVLFMEDGENPGADILHYLSDTMDEKAMRMVVIGEQYDIQRVSIRRLHVRWIMLFSYRPSRNILTRPNRELSGRASSWWMMIHSILQWSGSG